MNLPAGRLRPADDPPVRRKSRGRVHSSRPWRWLACTGHTGLITVLSLAPARLFPAPAGGIPGIDIGVHVAMYGVLGGLLRWAAGPRPLALAARGLPAAAAVYGLMLEGVQIGLNSAGRTGSWLDAWANLAGIVFGWWLADWMMNKARME